ncbi:MAG: CDP-glycerol glycerophosphotransferase family protein [Eubacteriales bacterium]|nr:CDP-glycerol glycerophosphotransferase family protein [Eubacteriales bacterium]
MLFFRTACEAALKERSTDHYQSIIYKLAHRKAPAGGSFWKIPQGEEKNREALTMLAHLLEQNVQAGALKVFQSEIERDIYKQKICKIVFLVQEYSVWPAVEFLYHAAAADSRFDVSAVYIPFKHPNATAEDNNLEKYRAAGIPVLNYDEYNLSEENPDVAVFTKPYSSIPKQFYISEVERVVKYTIYIPYGLELNKRLIRYGFHEYCHYTVWRHLAYGDIVKQYGIKYGYRNGENIVVWGHPRVDNYRVENLPAPNKEWKKKIDGRKVILWCPHHTIVPGPECVSTWLKNYEAVFALFEEHPEAVLLWRPHPLLFGAIVNNGHMSQKELDAFLAEKTAKDNIILDTTEDYRTAFSMSDAIITDGTTFSIEYLLTGKPLMVTTETLDQFYEPEEMESALYIGRTHEDIRSFVENILSNQDPKRDKRTQFADHLFLRFKDKSVSQNILDNILTDISEEIQRYFR